MMLRCSIREITFALSLLAGAPLLCSPAIAAPKDEARREYHEGKAAFELGKFKVALKHYERAYRLLPLAGFLFNIGQCQRNLDNYAKAIFAFRLYLRKSPEARNRVAVERLIADLEIRKRKEEERLRREAELKRQRELNDSPDPDPDPDPDRMLVKPLPPAPTPTRPIYKKWWFWTAIAAAIGGGVAGAYFGTRGGSSLPDSPFPVWDISK